MENKDKVIRVRVVLVESWKGKKMKYLKMISYVILYPQIMTYI